MNRVSPFRLLIKAAALLVVVALLFTQIDSDWLGRLTLYNHIVPGRARLPFGEDQQGAYNLSLYNLEAMLASHEISASDGGEDVQKVVVLGDSSVWGTLLRPEQTIAGQLNDRELTLCGKPARFYNLGYPTLSLLKDLLILDRTMRLEPDRVVWVTTLQSFPRDRQLAAPIVANNPTHARELISRYGLELPLDADAFIEPTFLDRTLFGRRRELADLFRLQLYGIMWAATGVDQMYPHDYARAATDLAADETFLGREPPAFEADSLAFDVLDAGIDRAGGVPMLLVNEPILVSNGANSGIRYNFLYPRWAYDRYRELIAEHAAQNGWEYLDLWDLIPPEDFTNTAIHVNAGGVQRMADEIASALASSSCP
jgi:hypothetical protein